MMAAVAAILTGCDWGGAGDGTWNDAYSWANFSGTYNLARTISTSSEEGGSSVDDPKYVPGVANFKAADGNVQSFKMPYGKIKPGTVKIAIGDLFTYHDDGKSGLAGEQKTAGSGTIDYDTGAWSITTAGAAKIPGGSKINCTFEYVGSTGDSGNPKDNGAVTITWINVNQQGNVFTFTDNKGVVYSGKITGASMPGSGYTVAGNIRLSFEVTAANGGKIVGSFNGDWSGASDASSGTLYNRSMNATYRRGKSSEQINAVSGSVAITPANVVGTEAAY